MIAPTDATTVLDRQLLLQLGGRLKRLRKLQGFSGVVMAQRVGISRTTLVSVEAGDPAPSIGTYVRVMSALGVSGELALLGSGALISESTASSKKATRPKETLTVVVNAADGAHELQDLQSLMLHKEAVRLMRTDPKFVEQAMATLEQWRNSTDKRSQFLWDEWSVILHRKEWRRALSNTRRAKELRQASPLPTILPPDIRKSVLDQVAVLKKGIKLGATE